MADFIPPKNELPEPKTTERVISSMSEQRAIFASEGGGAAVMAPSAPTMTPSAGSAQAATRHDASAVKRQIVCFTFYKVEPAWRRLADAEKIEQKTEFAAVLAKWNKPGEFLS